MSTRKMKGNELVVEPLEFEELVIKALASLPAYFQERLENVEVLVVDWPTKAEIRELGLFGRKQLLGLYRGIPLTDRTSSYNLVSPDTITLYQGPIEAACGYDLERIGRQVQRTVVHEIAHYFGIDDARLRELGAY